MCFFVGESSQETELTEKVRLPNNHYSNYLLHTYIRLLSYIIYLPYLTQLKCHTQLIHHYLSKTTHIIITNTVLQLDLFCHALPLTEMFKIQTNVFRVMEKYRIFIISQKFCS